MIREIFRKNLLLMTISSSLILAYFSQFFIQFNQKINFLPKFFIFLICFCYGCLFYTESIKKYLNKKALITGSLFCFIICPLITFLFCQIFLPENDYLRVGLIIISCMGPTITSGAIIIKNNNGDYNLAIILIIIFNLISIVTIPIILRFFFNEMNEIQTLAIFTKMLFFIFLPILLGYSLKKKFPKFLNKFKSIIEYAPIFLLGGVIFFSFLPYINLIESISFKKLILIFLYCLIIHQACFLLCFKIASFQQKFKQGIAISICSTEKTLPVAIIIWVDNFSKAYPLALVVFIIFHFTQIYSDIIMTKFLNKNLNNDTT